VLHTQSFRWAVFSLMQVCIEAGKYHLALIPFRYENPQHFFKKDPLLIEGDELTGRLPERFLATNVTLRNKGSVANTSQSPAQVQGRGQNISRTAMDSYTTS